MTVVAVTVRQWMEGIDSSGFSMTRYDWRVTMIARSFLVTLLVCYWVHPVSATTYYVDGSVGNDANSGTSTGNAWLHIDYAVSQVSNGDTILVKRDVLYIDEITIDGFTNLTLGTYGSGADPIIRASSGDDITLYVKDCSYIYINDFDLDGNSVGVKGLTIHNSTHVYPDNVDVDDYAARGVVIIDSEDCTLTDCGITNIDRVPASGENGTGVFMRGENDNITLDTCTITNNKYDGVACNPYYDLRMSNITLDSCTVKFNGRQGFRCQEVDGVDISGGDYSYNGASGIQIEAGTHDVTIDLVDCEYNGNDTYAYGNYKNESGIWIYGAIGVDLTNAYLHHNPYGIKMTRCEDVWIDECEIDDPDKNGSTGAKTVGIYIAPGPASERDRLDETSDITGMPFGGARSIDIDDITYTGFTGSDYHLSYGDVDQADVYDGWSSSLPDVDNDSIKDFIDVTYTGGTDANMDGVDDAPDAMTYRCIDITYKASQPSAFDELDFKVAGALGYVSEVAEAIQFNN